MRSTEEIRAEITQTAEKLETVGQDILSKHKEVKKLKENHTQWLTSNIGKERMPKSLAKQRDSLLSLALEIENLESVKCNLESKLADLKREHARAMLFDNNLAAYQTAERSFVEKAEMVIQEFIDQNKRMLSCKNSIEEFLNQSSNPLEILRSLLNDPALSGLSLRDFFLGHIVEAGSEENATFVQELVQVYRELFRKLPAPSNIKSDWVRLSNHFDLISRTANDLTPRSVRYIVSDQSPPPTQKTSQTIHINPRNLIAVEANRKREIEAMERKQYVRTIRQQ